MNENMKQKQKSNKDNENFVFMLVFTLRWNDGTSTSLSNYTAFKMGAGNSSNADKEEIKTWINQEISSNLVVVFSKTYCPYCRKAKNAFQAAGLDKYTVHELDKRNDGEIIQDVLKDITGARTVRISFHLLFLASLYTKIVYETYDFLN